MKPMRSLGQILKTQRENKRLTIDDVHKFIKIHPKYLEALESDTYAVFEGKVHAKGFLKMYADFLELNTSEVLALWRREYEAGFEKHKEEKFFQIKPVDPPGVTITPGFILGTIATVLIIGFFSYLFYQYRSFTGDPKLDIYYPQNNISVDSDILDITGKTELDSSVFINNQKVVLNMDGSFAASIKLKEGLNTLSIVAVNKLNKKTELIRTIIYRPEREPEKVIESSESTKSVKL